MPLVPLASQLCDWLRAGRVAPLRVGYLLRELFSPTQAYRPVWANTAAIHFLFHGAFAVLRSEDGAAADVKR